MDSFIIDITNKIISADRLLVIETVPEGERVLDAGESNMHVSFELPPGFRLSGQESLLVDGTLIGGDRNIQRIQMGGDVVVTGNVRFANITGERVFVGGGVEDCQITALKEVAIGNYVRNTDMSVGDFRCQKQKLDLLNKQIDEAEDRIISLQRRRRSEERHLYRDLTNTSFTIDFRFGDVIEVQSPSRVCVNLNSFYSILGDRTEEEIEQALDEFFRKGVLGVLMRKNIAFLRESVSRREAFKQVIGGLHDLFTQTLRIDNKVREKERIKADIDKLAEESSSNESVVSLHGLILPRFDLTFRLPQIEHLEDQLVVGRLTANFSLHISKEDRIELITVSTERDKSVEENPGKLGGLEFRFQHDRIVWEPLPAASEAS